MERAITMIIYLFYYRRDRLSKLKELPEYINDFKIIKCLGRINGSRRAIIVCKVCFREYEADPNKLQYRKHCGCMKSGRIVNKYRNTHPKLLAVYKDIKNRCYNKKRLSYKNYGGRGITVCDEWLSDSNVFCEWALKNGYYEGLSIDRINNNEGYSPNNCQWTTVTEQNRNRRGIKLNMELAKEIRRSIISNSILAKRYKVSIETIYSIKKNESWREDAPSGGAN